MAFPAGNTRTILPPAGSVARLLTILLRAGLLLPALRISPCANVLLEDVTLHHAGGMGVIAQRTDGITLRRLQVVLPPGKNRHVTTTADAPHFDGCRGNIVIESNSFTGQPPLRVQSLTPSARPLLRGNTGIGQE